MSNDRPWDPDGRYIQGVLKEYEYWTLEVSYRQHTFGNYIIFAKEDVERISELSPEALLELGTVMKTIEQALTQNKIFKPDRFNYLQMGNQLKRLHFHGIPRYETPRHFADREWNDKTWGHPPVWTKDEISPNLVVALRDSMSIGLV